MKVIDLGKLTKGKSDIEKVALYKKYLKMSEKEAWQVLYHKDVIDQKTSPKKKG